MEDKDNERKRHRDKDRQRNRYKQRGVVKSKKKNGLSFQVGATGYIIT